MGRALGTRAHPGLGVRFHNGAVAGLTLWPGRSVFVASLQVNAQFLRVYP